MGDKKKKAKKKELKKAQKLLKKGQKLDEKLARRLAQLARREARLQETVRESEALLAAFYTRHGLDTTRHKTDKAVKVCFLHPRRACRALP